MEVIRRNRIAVISCICLGLFFSADTFAEDGRKHLRDCKFETSISEAKEIILKGKIQNSGFTDYTHFLLIAYRDEIFSCTVAGTGGAPICNVYGDVSMSSFFCLP